MSTEYNNEENATEESNKINISNNEISANIDTTPNNNNATQENSLLANQHLETRLQISRGLVHNLPVIAHSDQQELEQEEGKFAILGDLATFFFFILYLADIWSDISLAVYFFSIGKSEYGYEVLIPVYVSSFMTVIFERETREVKSLKKHYLWAFIIFIFNLSGVLIYLEITSILCRKLRKKPYNKDLLESKQHTLKTLKTAEACFEAFPQIYFQTRILSESLVTNEHITWLQYVSIAISTLGFIFSIAGFIIIFTQNCPNTKIYGKIIKYLWIFFDTVLFIVLSLVVIMPAVPSLGFSNILLLVIVFIIYPIFNIFVYMEISSAYNLLDLQKKILMIFLSTSSYFPFELKCFNSWKPNLARIVLSGAVILATIRWYYCRNEISMNLPFTFDFINYVSILCCVLGLIVNIFVVVQIIRVPRVRSDDNVVHYVLFFSH